MAVAPSVDLIAWKPMRARQQQTAVSHLPSAKGRVTCLLSLETQEGSRWMVLRVAVFSAAGQFDPHSSWLVTDWGLFRAATWGSLT